MLPALRGVAAGDHPPRRTGQGDGIGDGVLIADRIDVAITLGGGDSRAPHMDCGTDGAVVTVVQNASYAALFEQAYGANVFGDTQTAFTDVGLALQAYQQGRSEFHRVHQQVRLLVHVRSQHG